MPSPSEGQAERAAAALTQERGRRARGQVLSGIVRIKLKAERRRKEEDAQPKPMVRTVHDCPEAISRLARPEPRPEPRVYSEPRHIPGEALPKTYGAPAARSGTIVERASVARGEARAPRRGERRRRKEKEAEVAAKPPARGPRGLGQGRTSSTVIPVRRRVRRQLPSCQDDVDALSVERYDDIPRHRVGVEMAWKVAETPSTRPLRHTGAGGARQGGTGRARTRTDEGTARSQEGSAPPAEGRRDRGHARGAEAQLNSGGQAGQAKGWTQGHGPHEGVALGRAQTRSRAGTRRRPWPTRRRAAGDGRGPVPRPRALPPQLRRAAHSRWRRGSSDDEASIASEARGRDRSPDARGVAASEEDAGFFDPTSSEERGRTGATRLFEPSMRPAPSRGTSCCCWARAGTRARPCSACCHVAVCGRRRGARAGGWREQKLLRVVQADPRCCSRGGAVRGRRQRHGRYSDAFERTVLVGGGRRRRSCGARGDLPRPQRSRSDRGDWASSPDVVLSPVWLSESASNEEGLCVFQPHCRY